MSQEDKKPSPAIAPIMIIVVGAFTVIAMTVGIFDAASNVNWPTTEGRIAKEVEALTFAIDHEAKTIRPKSPRDIIIYDYTVDGKSYKGYSSRAVKYTNTNNVEVKNHEDIRLVVYYDPSDASRSVMQTGVSSAKVAALLFGLFLVAGGIALLKLHRKQNAQI